MAQSHSSSHQRAGPVASTSRSLTIPKNLAPVAGHQDVTMKNLVEFIWKATRSGQTRKYVDNCPADKVTHVLNLLEEYIKYVPYNDPLRRGAIYLMRRLTRATEKLPRNITISGVEYDPDEESTHSGNSEVWQGTYKGQLVAVKQLSLTDHIQHRFYREVTTWRYLKHDNILPLLGIVVKPKRPNHPLLVSPWMDNGTLDKFIQTDTYIKKCREQRKRLAREIARALYYLHSQKIVHGDIKDKNILIGDAYQALIADFGTSVTGNITTARDTHTSVSGTMRWMSPERFAESIIPPPATEKAPSMDVYAYGCVCFTLCVGKAYYYWIRNEADVRDKVIARGRPDPPLCQDKMPVEDSFYQLMKQCWAHDPAARLTMSNVLAYFAAKTAAVVPPPMLFMLQARVTVDFDETETGLPLQKKEWVEIHSCSSETWIGRTPNGVVGYIEKPQEQFYDGALCRITMGGTTNHSTPLPPFRDSLPFLSPRKGEIFHVYAFDEEFWLVRTVPAEKPGKKAAQHGTPRKFGFVSTKDIVHVDWPRTEDGHVAQYKAAFSYARNAKEFPFHLTIRANEQVEVQSHHPGDEWLMATVGKQRGIVPAQYLCIASE